MNLVPSFALFFLLCNPVAPEEVEIFRRNKNSCNCLNGGCDQRECAPHTAKCTGGTRCNQEGTIGPSCLSGHCFQANSIDPTCIAGQCDQRGATNPTCKGGGCCRDTLDNSKQTCLGGYMQPGDGNDNACGPNANGCHITPSLHPFEESSYLRG